MLARSVGVVVALVLFAGCSPSPTADGCRDAPDAAGLSTRCGFAKPEDVEYVPSRSLVLVSEQGWDAPSSGGGVSALAVDPSTRTLGQARRLWPSESQSGAPAGNVGDPTCSSPPSPDGFSPHGLVARDEPDGAATRVAVVAHGAREAIELFDLTGEGEAARLAWHGCLPLPENTAGNDVAIAPDGRLFVTNYIPTTHGIRALLALLRALRGEVTGDVLVWSSEEGWRHLAGTEAALPNGLVLDRDASNLYVAESGRSRVLHFALGRDGSATLARELPVGGAPDNLSWSSRGTLLVAVLDPRATKEWTLVDVDPASGAARALVAGERARIHSVTSATELDGRIVLGSMSDDRIAIVDRTR